MSLYLEGSKLVESNSLVYAISGRMSPKSARKVVRVLKISVWLEGSQLVKSN